VSCWSGSRCCSKLRAEIDIGIRELDAGLGEELDIDDVIREAHEEHGKGA
jgi:hypothetical protein